MGWGGVEGVCGLAGGGGGGAQRVAQRQPGGVLCCLLTCQVGCCWRSCCVSVVRKGRWDTEAVGLCPALLFLAPPLLSF